MSPASTPAGSVQLQAGGLAGVARVFPVGVPLRLVDELQADPNRFAGVHAIGCMGHQLGAHLLGGDRGLYGILASGPCAIVRKQLSKTRQREGCVRGFSEGHRVIGGGQVGEVPRAELHAFMASALSGNSAA